MCAAVQRIFTIATFQDVDIVSSLQVAVINATVQFMGNHDGVTIDRSPSVQCAVGQLNTREQPSTLQRLGNDGCRLPLSPYVSHIPAWMLR